MLVRFCVFFANQPRSILMKKIIISLLATIVLSLGQLAHAQKIPASQFPTKGHSIHIGSSLIHSLVSANFEHYKHSIDDRHHWGVGYGVSAGVGYLGLGLGGHVMGNYWYGRGKNHFEARLGVTPTFFTGGEYEPGTWAVIPIVLVGYRRQVPGSDKFFFLNIGTVGVGVGFGKALD